MPCRASPRATLQQELLQGDEPGADRQADGQHDGRMAPVARTERVPDAHDVPLARGVAPGQTVILGHDRQLVGGPLGETEGGGVGEGPARAVRRAGRGAFEPPRLHPRPHAHPVLGTHQPALRRALGPRAHALEEPSGHEDDGDGDSDGQRPRRQGVGDRLALAAAHRAPPQQSRKHQRDECGREGEHTPAALDEALPLGVAHDRGGEPPPPPPRQAQPGDLDTRAGDAGEGPGGELVDVVEHLLLVAGQVVTLPTAAIGEHDDLVLGVLDAQPAAGDQVEERGDGGRRGDHEAVRQQAGDRR